MAVLKHIAIKNADYSAAVCYLKYQHDERHLKPLLDENGSMMLRSEFHMNGVNCNPDTFDLECEMLNDQYRKNYRYDEVKSHHYIISFDPRDKDEHHLTGEKAQTLGLEFVKNHLPGHQALVCTHTDGHNGSGNIHVHIIINSLRKLDIEPQSYTTRSIDCKAGYKHHLTKDYLKYLQQELMNLCQRENLYQVDLLSPAQHKITEAEYWLQKRGQKELEDINEQIIADGMNPMETTFQTRKQFVRNFCFFRSLILVIHGCLERHIPRLDIFQQCQQVTPAQLCAADSPNDLIVLFLFLCSPDISQVLFQFRDLAFGFLCIIQKLLQLFAHLASLLSST